MNSPSPLSKRNHLLSYIKLKSTSLARILLFHYHNVNLPKKENKKMRMIIFSSSQREIGDRLKKLVQDTLPGIEVELVDSKSDLLKKLNRPLSNISIIVSVIGDSDDISSLISLKQLLDNSRQILILPDRSAQMMESGLKLEPSYISYHDSDLMHVFSVIKKIYKRQK